MLKMVFILQDDSVFLGEGLRKDLISYYYSFEECNTCTHIYRGAGERELDCLIKKIITLTFLAQ